MTLMACCVLAETYRRLVAGMMARYRSLTAPGMEIVVLGDIDARSVVVL